MCVQEHVRVSLSRVFTNIPVPSNLIEMSFNEFHPNSKPLFVMTFLDIPSLLDLISTASNLRSDTGLRSWLASLNSDSRDFAFVKRKKTLHLRKIFLQMINRQYLCAFYGRTLIFSFNLHIILLVKHGCYDQNLLINVLITLH